MPKGQISTSANFGDFSYFFLFLLSIFLYQFIQNVRTSVVNIVSSASEERDETMMTTNANDDNDDDHHHHHYMTIISSSSSSSCSILMEMIACLPLFVCLLCRNVCSVCLLTKQRNRFECIITSQLRAQCVVVPDDAVRCSVNIQFETNYLNKIKVNQLLPVISTVMRCNLKILHLLKCRCSALAFSIKVRSLFSAHNPRTHTHNRWQFLCAINELYLWAQAKHNSNKSVHRL